MKGTVLTQRGTMLIALALVVGLVVLAVKARDFLTQSGHGTHGRESPPLSDAQVKIREDMLESVFFTCMGEMKDEIFCLDRFGRMTWYPRDAAECEGVGTRVDKVIALGGEPKWRDLFKNERCARRGLPHSVEAVTAGAEEPPDSPWRRCATGFSNRNTCREKYGNHLWYPWEDDDCSSASRFVDYLVEDRRGQLPGQRTPIDWVFLFENERCWRLGREFLPPELLQ